MITKTLMIAGPVLAMSQFAVIPMIVMIQQANFLREGEEEEAGF